MKKIYWRPTQTSRSVLILIAFLAMLGLFWVEYAKQNVRQSYYREKIAAARLALNAFQIIKNEKTRLGITIDPEVDPSQSGLIGVFTSSITSNRGDLTAKQSTLNPNFAAIIVELLKKAKVREGDYVAVGLSGSFPALNVCVYAAITTLKLKPIIISSATASQWGANLSNLSWLHMDQLLYDKDIYSFKSFAASLGGIEDKGIGLADEGKIILKNLINQSKLQFIENESYEQGVEQHMKLYQELAQGYPIKAYINVGGGTVSVGKKEGKLLYKPGLILSAPSQNNKINSIMSRFLEQEIPVIHLTNIKEFLKVYRLPEAPGKMPEVGTGYVYTKVAYRPWLTFFVLSLLITLVYLFIRQDLGIRFIQSLKQNNSKSSHPEQMV